MNPYANRIQSSLAEIRQRGRFERLEPCSILIETRRLLESERLERSFPLVKLYCDWCAHCQLDRDGAAHVLLEITDALNSSIRNSSNAAAIKSLYDGVCSSLSISNFQQQLVNLYGQYGVDTWHLTDVLRFQQFMGAVLDAIAEVPLCFPRDIATKRGKIREMYDKTCRLAGNDPKRIITQCLVTNELSKEQLAFYKVPEGTYLWQIMNAAGVEFCGVLYAGKKTGQGG